jgi:hypothetical protein
MYFRSLYWKKTLSTELLFCWFRLINHCWFTVSLVTTADMADSLQNVLLIVLKCGSDCLPKFGSCLNHDVYGCLTDP